VVYGFDAERRLVWFETAKPDETSRLAGGVLCAEHADRMSVPRGWHLDDRRQAVPQLLPVPKPAKPPRAPRAKRAAAVTETSAPTGDETLSLFDLEEFREADADGSGDAAFDTDDADGEH